MKIGLTSDERLADRHVDDRLLDDPAAAAQRPRRRQRRHLGRAAEDVPGPGRAGTDCAQHGVTLDRSWTTTADALDAGLLQFSDGLAIGTGGFVDTPNQRLADPARPADRRRRRTWRTIVGRRSATARTVRAGRRRRCGRGPPAADRRRGHQRRCRGSCSSSRSSRGRNTLDVTRGVEAGDGGDAARPAGDRDRHRRSSGRPRSSSSALDNLTHALLLGCVLVILVLIVFLFDWRTALISVVAIPLSLMAAALVLDLAGRHDQHDDPRRAWSSPSASSSTTPSSTSRTSCGASGSTAGRAARQSTASIILEASLEVRSADRLRDADRRWSPSLPVFFLDGSAGRFFQPLAISYALAVLARWSSR